MEILTNWEDTKLAQRINLEVFGSPMSSPVSRVIGARFALDLRNQQGVGLGMYRIEEIESVANLVPLTDSLSFD